MCNFLWQYLAAYHQKQTRTILSACLVVVTPISALLWYSYHNCYPCTAGMGVAYYFAFVC